MGNTRSNNITSNNTTSNNTTRNNIETLKFDRIIDGETDIFIGIVAKQKTNQYSSQAIRLGIGGKLKRLESFEETDNYLKFNYESNTTMCLTKENNDIIIHIKDAENNINMIKPMEPVCREIFKPIKFSDLSKEYDKIPDFIRPEFNELQTDMGKYFLYREKIKNKKKEG